MDVGEQSIEQFLGDIASENVSPASGSAVAITGAMGAALCEMTCIHTLNNDPGGVDIEVESIGNQLAGHRTQLLALARQDAQIIEAVFAGSSPDPSQAEIKRLMGIPLSVAEVSLGILEHGGRVVEGIDRAVASDAKTGIILAYAAFDGALFIVQSNLDQVSDQTFAEQLDGRIEELLEAAENIAEDLPRSPSSNLRRG